ncbi:MAG: sigma 54-interacting transcriptional regulator [Bacteroidales bacterium]|nr:sigma 54-interacting transcriptional regulator [Bacteroidales bacterium]
MVKTGSKKNKTQNQTTSANNDKFKSDIYHQLFEIGKRLLTESEVNKLLYSAMDEAIQISGAERGMIILFDETNQIQFQTARNINKEEIKNPEFEVSRTIINTVKKDKEPIYLQNALEKSEYMKKESVKKLQLLSVICLPLIHQKKLFGVVYLDNRTFAGIFQPDTCQFVNEFANFISLAAYQALERKKLQNHVNELEKELRGKYKFESIIGHHPKMMEILKLVSQVADTDATVLIQGETGTGKELIARALHYNSKRKDKPFVPVNCGAIPEPLLESELFGHVRGAFTGAIKDKAGWFEVANYGTIFLDEINDMSPALQVRLLRVLQTGEYSQVGSTEICYCDVRVVSASSKKLQQLIKVGEFRDELYYRLNVIEIELPPLRERRSDIPLLFKHFLNFYNKKCNKSVSRLSSETETLLQAYSFPGNVRELENIIQRAVTLAENDLIESHLLPTSVRGEQTTVSETTKQLTLIEAKRSAAKKAEIDFIKECLQATSGHISKAAKMAGMDVGNFHRIITRHKIDVSVFKSPSKSNFNNTD